MAAQQQRVGIIGASGLVGQFLTPGFLSHGGWDVTLLTRKGGSGKLAELAAKGAKVVEVDFSSPQELKAALQGLDTVVSAVGTEGLLGQVEVIKAAKEAGVRRFVPSEFGLDTGAPGVREYFPLLGYKFATRDALEASGLEWTYVVTGFFVESTFTPFFGWDAQGAGRVTLKGKADAPFTVTSLVDIGRWLPALLKDPASRNATVYLKGEDVTFDQAVEVASQALGRKLEVTRRSAAELEQDIASAPTPFAAFPDLLLRAVADGWARVPEGKQWNAAAEAGAPRVSVAKHFEALAAASGSKEQ